MFRIGKVQFSRKKTVIIAEAGVNHLGKINYAEELIKTASRAGADIIKFQTYKADSLTVKKAPRFWSWKGEKKKKGTQYDSYSLLDNFGKNEYIILKKICDKFKIEFLSTPFDFQSADMLDSIGMKGFKIASCDITNIPLIDHISKKNKPILLSTGASNINEIKRAVKTIEGNGNKKILIMHCILCYPTEYKDANLGAINHLNATFPNYLIGISDHTLGIRVASSSVLVGAKAIEKHYTFDKKLPLSADHWLSINEKELKTLVDEVRFNEKIFGKEIKNKIKCENRAHSYARRSIVSKVDILKGEKLSYENLDFKRPGTGISPADVKKVINKRAKRNIKKDSVIKNKDFY